MPAAAPAIERPPLDRTTVERFGIQRGEPDWLRESRLAAYERFVETPWPRSDVGEEWRRFPIADAPFAKISQPAAVEISVRAPRAEGLTVLPLDEAVRARPDLVRSSIAGDGGPRSHAAIRALAHAAWSAGAFVHAAPNTVVTAPIEVGVGAGITRTVVVAERDSSVKVIEDLTSRGEEAALAIPVLDVFVGPGASVEYVQLQRYGEGMWDLGLQRYRSERDSRLSSFNVVVGGSRSKVGIHSDIVGDGATVHLYGLVAGGGDQKIDINTFQDLAGSHSVSDLLYLAALYDSAKAVYYGVIRVNPQTRGTSSYQECRNMLLSENAGADPIPVLEILTNDVARCGHGATAGAIDPTEIFYIQSRGLTKEQAEKLLVRGFFERVFAKADRSLRRRMLDAVAPRIGRIFELEDEGAA